MKRDSEALKLRTKDFALRVLRLYRSLPRTEEARILGTQLLLLEEADETVFWLELFQEGNIFPAEKLHDLVQEANELVSIFVSSVRTARGLPLQSDL